MLGTKYLFKGKIKDYKIVSHQIIAIQSGY